MRNDSCQMGVADGRRVCAGAGDLVNTQEQSGVTMPGEQCAKLLVSAFPF
jgi:ethanolamine utilization protein EutQ (cupin superfamily)